MIQMQSYFGWKNSGMAMEYISKSKVALKDVATRLAFSEREGNMGSII